MTECPIKPRQPTSIGITWHIQPFSTLSKRSRHAVTRSGFSSACVLPPGFFSQGTVNSLGRTLFFESDRATMSGRFSVWLMWTGNCRVVLRFFVSSQDICALNNSIKTSNTLLCRHVYIWSDVDMQIVRGAKYPDHFYTTSTGISP